MLKLKTTSVDQTAAIPLLRGARGVFLSGFQLASAIKYRIIVEDN